MYIDKAKQIGSKPHSSKALPSQAVCSSQALPVINTMKHLG